MQLFLRSSSLFLRFGFIGLVLSLSGLANSPVLANEMNAHQYELIKALHTQLLPGAGEQLHISLNRSRLREFYQSRNYYPVWLDEHGPLPRAASLRQVLNGAEDEGLAYNDYYPELITSRWKTRLPEKLAELELLLSDAFFRYSEHVQTGYRKPNVDEYYRDIIPPEIDPIKDLDNLLKSDNFLVELQELSPHHEGYRRLRNALKKYRDIELQGGWQAIPEGPSLGIGTWDKQVALIRKRLIAEGDLELTPVYNKNHFDQAMKFAVERFQVRHGLKMDGVVGAETRAAMNIPVKERIQLIKNNMERWRWLPGQLGQRYIMVNMAGYELAVVNENKTQFTMDVIIGTTKRPTPMVKGRLHTVVFNPYWTLPQTIIFEDILPRQIRNPNYMKLKGIQVFTNGKERDPANIDWRKTDHNNFPYILRQAPGPKNPLGRIKFLFSNNYDVYLHDTPKKQLFDKEVRAFSSGCVRVGQPYKLASYLLGEENGWSEEEIKNQIDSGEHQKISVAGKVPVYLVYMTSWVGENNGVHFRPDIYRWDANIQKCDEIP